MPTTIIYECGILEDRATRTFRAPPAPGVYPSWGRALLARWLWLERERTALASLLAAFNPFVAVDQFVADWPQSIGPFIEHLIRHPILLQKVAPNYPAPEETVMVTKGAIEAYENVTHGPFHDALIRIACALEAASTDDPAPTMSPSPPEPRGP